MDWKDALQQLKGDLPEGAPAPGDAPEAAAPKRPADPRLDIILDRKGRKGKEATIVAGFSPDTPDDEIAALASKLKQQLGTGGSARGGEILIQGDKRQALLQALTRMGYRARII